jgi:hypothetical protein
MWPLGSALRLRKEHKTLSKNKVVKRIYVLIKENITEGERILHTEEFHSLCYLSNIFRRIRWRRMRWLHKTLIRKLQEDFGIDRRIVLKWIFRETGCEVLDWIQLLLRIVYSGGLLWTQWSTSRFHKISHIYVESVFLGRSYTKELVNYF